MLHLHILSWLLVLILFYSSYENFSDRQGPSRLYKPLHMTLRLFMLITIVSGIVLFVQAMKGDIDHMMYGLKFVFGLATIGLAEMTLAKKKKKKPSRTFFIITFVVALITIGLGLHLPMVGIMGMFK